MIEFRCSLCLTLLENPSVCITSRSERERDTHMRQSRSTPAVCRIPPLLVRYTHASRAPVAAADDEDDEDEDSPDHRSRAADRVIAAAARDSSRYMSSARAGAITVSPHLRFRSDVSSEESRVIESWSDRSVGGLLITGIWRDPASDLRGSICVHLSIGYRSIYLLRYSSEVKINKLSYLVDALIARDSVNHSDQLVITYR